MEQKLCQSMIVNSSKVLPLFTTTDFVDVSATAIAFFWNDFCLLVDVAKASTKSVNKCCNLDEFA